MATLLSLPVELRLRIYENLPQLQSGHYETVTAYSKLTPDICRVSRVLRDETLPLYASGGLFAIQIDGSPALWTRRITSWLRALGPDSVSRLRSLQINRHWQIPLPMRWQGHVGFYVRVEHRKPERLPSRSSVNSTSSFRSEWNERFVLPMAEGVYSVTTGTYPIARDFRGMRLESVELLAKIVRRHLHVSTLNPDSPDSESRSSNARPGLTANDVQFLVKAMEIVANHPVSNYDHQRHDGRQRKPEAWTEMERELRALNVQDMCIVPLQDHSDMPSFGTVLT